MNNESMNGNKAAVAMEVEEDGRSLYRRFLQALDLYDGGVCLYGGEYLSLFARHMPLRPQVIWDAQTQQAPGAAIAKAAVEGYLAQATMALGPGAEPVRLTDFLTIGGRIRNLMSHGIPGKSDHCESDPLVRNFWAVADTQTRRYIEDCFIKVVVEAGYELDRVMLPYMESDRQMFAARWEGDLDYPTQGAWHVRIMSRPSVCQTRCIDGQEQEFYWLNVLNDPGGPEGATSGWNRLFDPEGYHPWEKIYYRTFVSKQVLEDFRRFADLFGDHRDIVLQVMYLSLNDLGPIKRDAAGRSVYDLPAWGRREESLGRMYLHVENEPDELFVTRCTLVELTSSERQSHLKDLLQQRSREMTACIKANQAPPLLFPQPSLISYPAGYFG